MKYLYTIFFFFGIILSSFSQTAKTDSLEELLGKVSGKEKVKVMNELTEEWVSISLKKSLEYNKSALHAAKQINDIKGEADALYNRGGIYIYSGKYDTALINFKKALSIYTKINEKKSIVKSHIGIAVTYWKISDYNKALSYNKKALEVSNEIQYKEGKALAFNNLGLIYNNLGDYDKTLQYFIKSLKLFEELKSDSQAGVLINIGVIFAESLNEYEKALYYYFKALKTVKKKMSKKTAVVFCNIGNVYTKMENYEKADEYLNKALKLYKQFDDKNGIAYIFMNFGIIFEQKGNYELSEENYLKSEEIFTEINDNYNISLINNLIAEINLKMHNYNESQKNLKKSRIIAKQIGAKELLKENYDIFSDLYAAKKDYKNAYKYHKIYFELHDSLYNEETKNKINELEIRYETEKKEKQILVLTKEKELETANVKKQKLIKYFLIASLLFILAFALVMYRNNRIKKRLNAQLKSEKEFLQTLMDANPNPQYFKDKQGKYIGCNVSFEKIIGLTKDEIIGKTIKDITTIKIPTENIDIDNELLKTLGTKKYFGSIVIADKQKREYEFIKTVYGKKGSQSQGILGIMVDITHLKKQEELIREQENLIHEQEKEKLQTELDLKKREIVANALQLIENSNLINEIVNEINVVKQKANQQTANQLLLITNGCSLKQKVFNRKEFEHRFKDVNKSFYSNLKKYHSDLSSSEKHLCSFLRLDMSTKQISAITYQSIHAINKARTRLRKKLGITNSEESISFFLSRF